MTRYISAVDTAKLIRAQLKSRFPGVKFSVKTDTYAGGASIDIAWIDGPTTGQVDCVVSAFGGRGFDGMIDMAYTKDAYLLPDGSAVLAQVNGTEGSAGVVPDFKTFKPAADAERVHFGANYIFTKRTHSPRLVQSALVAFATRYGREAAEAFDVRVSSWDGGAHAELRTDCPDDRYWLQTNFNKILARRVIAR